MRALATNVKKAVFGPIGTLFSLVLFLSVIFLPELLGRLEGRLNPVVTQVKFHATKTSSKVTEIKGRMFVERTECVFDHIEWFLVTPGRTALADVVFKNGTVARPGGWSDFGPWDVAMDLRQITDSSLAFAYHRCPWRPWLVETQFYPDVSIEEVDP